jgi:hypothetical protein
MPFAGNEGFVTTLSQHLWKERQSRPIPTILNPHPMAPRHEHRPTRHTNSATIRTGTIIPAKAKSLTGQSIEIRSLDMRIPERPNRIRPLIIGEQQNDVWPPLFSRTDKDTKRSQNHRAKDQ